MDQNEAVAVRPFRHRFKGFTMRVIEQLVHHFWARGALTREEALYLVEHGFVRDADLPGLTDHQHAPTGTTDHHTLTPEEDRRRYGETDETARAAEELEDELVGRNAGSRKAGGKKKKPTGHNLAPVVAALSAHLAAREPYPALVELGARLGPCVTWRDAAQAVGAARPAALETALVGLLTARPRALGELWHWFDLEPLFDWADDPVNAGPVAESLSKLLRADTPARVGRLDQLAKAREVPLLLGLLPARRAFLNLLPVLYHVHFPKLGLWLVPPTGPALGCWPALLWAFVIVYNARHGTAAHAPPGYPLDPQSVPEKLLRTALTTAIAQAPVAVRELLIHEFHGAAAPTFGRPLHCPFAWRA